MTVREVTSRRVGASADARGRDALLAAARRIDWRFLLPDPAPERVALVGRGDERLRDSLATFCSPPMRWKDPPTAPEEHGRFDLVVVTSGHPGDAREAARLVAPGGTLRWEVRGSPSSRAAETALREAGLEDIVAHWHRPGFEDALEAIPLGSSRVLDHVLAPGTHGRAGEARRAAVRWLRRVGLLELVATSRGVMGRRGTASESGLPGRLRTLAAARGGGSPENAVILLRTPRFRASGHVLLFAFPEDSMMPALLAKVARVPGPAPSLEREAGSLGALAGVADGGIGGVPRLVERTTVGGSIAILETIVAGVTVHPDHVRRAPEDHTVPFVDWLTDLHQRTRAYAIASDWWEQAVERPLARIVALFGDGSPEADLAARTRERIAPLREGAATWVWEHGDLSAPNLLLDGDRPGVVDWELGTPHGVPGSDLFFFLGFIAYARERAATAPAARAALRRAFFGRTPWAASSVERYAARVGLDRAQLPALYVLTWARNVASYVERLEADRDAVTAAEDLRAWLRRERAFAAWEDAVRGFDDLRPAGEARRSA